MYEHKDILEVLSTQNKDDLMREMADGFAESSTRLNTHEQELKGMAHNMQLLREEVTKLDMQLSG